MAFKIKNISTFFVLLFITGVLSASFHLHVDEGHAADSEPPHYVQDHNFCSLCASQFTYSKDHDLESETVFEPGEFVPDLQPAIFAPPLVLLQNYRAPPFLS
ncbi:hypothetical protein DDZ15_05290 [Rhodohalobacter mucosus]|uniref:Uncharacterized protein n=1 Tax=Rhodohalobacter mucosus TaxID=2079485 RepID=A0A316TX98_9BACT|nr:hypothetical protein DDZ15_05290 [Rhodohalobacter mucosus]